jgi:hypothetical protein
MCDGEKLVQMAGGGSSQGVSHKTQLKPKCLSTGMRSRFDAQVGTRAGRIGMGKATRAHEVGSHQGHQVGALEWAHKMGTGWAHKVGPEVGAQGGRTEVGAPKKVPAGI